MKLDVMAPLPHRKDVTHRNGKVGLEFTGSKLLLRLASATLFLPNCASVGACGATACCYRADFGQAQVGLWACLDPDLRPSAHLKYLQSCQSGPQPRRACLNYLPAARPLTKPTKQP